MSAEHRPTSDSYVVTDVPARTRAWRAAFAVVVGAAIPAIWFADRPSSMHAAVPIVWALAWSALAVYCWRCVRERRLSPEAKQARAAVEAEARLKAAQRDDRWYVRYPIAGLMLYAAWHIANDEPDLWWFAVAGVLAALVQAREVSVVLLIVGVFVLAIKGIASLPVSAAVIVGALIVAAAIRR